MGKTTSHHCKRCLGGPKPLNKKTTLTPRKDEGHHPSAKQEPAYRDMPVGPWRQGQNLSRFIEAVEVFNKEMQ